MIEQHLYIITSYSRVRYYDNKFKLNKPQYMDSAGSNDWNDLDYSQVYMLNGDILNDYSSINIVAAVTVDNPEAQPAIKAYIGNRGQETIFTCLMAIFI